MIREERFEIPSRDGYPLRGDVRYPAAAIGSQASPPAIVVCHGFKGFKDWGCFPTIGRDLAEAGYLAVSFNFSGSGIGADLLNFTDVERFEHATISGDLDDLSRVLDAIASDGLPGPRASEHGIGLLGHSRGGGVALLAGAEDARVRAVAVWGSVSSFGRWSPGTIADWRERGYVPVENMRTKQVFHLRTDILDDLTAHGQGRLNIERASNALAARQVPVLVVHGDADESVKIQEGRAIAGWSAGELVELPGAGHTFGAVHPFRGRTPDLDRALGVTRDFFHRYLPAAVAGS
jgi:pimeloyl-ACP methyl ester carboxylesterase